jgi:hypothetical protein
MLIFACASGVNASQTPETFLTLSFNEPVGTKLAELDGASMYSGATNLRTTNVVAAASLTYSNVSVSGSKLLLTGAAEAVFPLSRTSSEAVVANNNTYVSSIIKVSRISNLATNGIRVLSLRGGNDNVPVASLWVRDVGGKVQVGMQRPGNSVQWNPEEHEPNASIFTVMEYSWEAPFGRPGGLHGYLMPPQDDLLQPTKADGAGAAFWTYSYTDSFLPHSLSLVGHNDSIVYIDEVRVGSTWGDVVRLSPSSSMPRGQSPRFNTFILQSAQAGSTTDIDNLRIVDLDTGSVVYSNDFSSTNKATNNLQLFYFPQGGVNTTNFVVNGPMTRVVNGKLRLETTGFGRNGSGGYESHSEAEYTQPLPHNFLVEFDAVRLQWAGHFHFHVSYRDPSDPPSSNEPFGSYTTNRVAPYRLDWLRMASSGSWFQQYGVHINAGLTNSSWPIMFPAPKGSLLNQTHKLGISLSNNIASFYLDGQLLNTADISEYLGASGDFDGDGVNDYREGEDGTDPNDPESFNPLSKGLVAYYPFDGNANDESGYGNNGTAVGVTLAADRLEVSDSAYSFTGALSPESNIKLAGAAVNLPGQKTVSAWVRYEGSEQNPRIFSTAGYEVSINAGSKVAINQTSDGGSVDTLESGEGIFSGRFAHVVGVWSDEGMTVYIDGQLAASKAWDGASVADFARGFVPEIGGNSGSQFDPFGGVIDNIRVYNRALSPAEVQRLYADEGAGMDSDSDSVTDYRERRDGTNPWDSSSFDPLSKNLVAHYPFDGDTLDESGYANHAVNNGAAASTDRFGEVGTAYDFNGVDAYMDAPPLVSDYQRNFTFSGWLKTTHVSSDRLDAAVSALCKTRDAGDFGGPAIDFREGKAIFTFNNNGVYGDLVPFEEWEYATEEILADGNWRHYIMSIDADGLITAFINGQQVASHQITTFLEVTSASPFQIGRAGGLHAAARYFPGQIDEVRVYNRGLTAEEAAMLYRESVCGLDSDADGVTDYRENRDGTNPYDVASFEPLSVALIANYPFDNSWKDESGYCRDVLAPYTTFEPGLSGQSLGLAEGNSQASYWNDPNNIESPGRINNFTFSVWMKPATLDQADGAWYHLVSAPNNAAYLRIGNAVGTPGAKVLGMGYSWSGIPGFDYTTPALTSLQESFWQHVVGVQQGVSTAIYINGRLVGSLVEGQEILFDPENFTIGNLFNKDTFQGQLDEVRIYGRALSPAEVAALYALEVGDLDSDNDGLDDVHETNTGAFVSATDAGTDPYNPDTSGDGILDGEAVLWDFNPLTNHSQVLAFLRHATGVQSGRFGLFTEGSIMDLKLGGVMMQKSGNQASVRFKVETKMDMRDPAWTDKGTYLLPPIDMPGSKGFLRISAE